MQLAILIIRVPLSDWRRLLAMAGHFVFGIVLANGSSSTMAPGSPPVKSYWFFGLSGHSLVKCSNLRKSLVGGQRCPLRTRCARLLIGWKPFHHRLRSNVAGRLYWDVANYAADHNQHQVSWPRVCFLAGCTVYSSSMALCLRAPRAHTLQQSKETATGTAIWATYGQLRTMATTSSGAMHACAVHLVHAP